MLLGIYLCISVVTVILFTLYNLSSINQVKHKLKDKIDTTETNEKQYDFAGVLLSWIKMFVVSFVPILNILMLIVLLFFADKIQKEIVNKRIDGIIERKENI